MDIFKKRKRFMKETKNFHATFCVKKKLKKKL